MCGSELLALPEGVQKVAALLQSMGHAHAPVMLDGAARTAQEAADALGVGIGQIAKSIVFRRRSDEVAVLVVTSGDQRVDEKKVEALVCADGKRLGRADAAFVKSRTGFSIGGVAPLAHATPTVVLIDQSLFRFDEVWAAAGHPHAVFKLSPADLQRLTGAPVADFAVDVGQERLAQQHAINLVAIRARNMEAAGDIPSPCISICRLNDASGLCDGCFRTRDEIAAWGNAGDERKRGIWKLIGQRMAELQA
ncbi:MAG: YbaK/EbsC family protein [Polaromonas sp.]